MPGLNPDHLLAAVQTHLDRPGGQLGCRYRDDPFVFDIVKADGGKGAPGVEKKMAFLGPVRAGDRPKNLKNILKNDAQLKRPFFNILSAHLAE